MHRLPRQIASSTRLLRVSRASVEKKSPLIPRSFRRNYASPKLWTLPPKLATGRFAELYKLLRPDLTHEELAKLGAALMKNATDDLQAERVQLVMEMNYSHLDQDKLQEDVTRLLESGEDFASSLLAPPPTQQKAKPTQKAVESSSQEQEPGTSSFSVDGTPAIDIETADQLLEILDTEQGRAAVSQLTEREKEFFEEIAEHMSGMNEQDFIGLQKMAQILGRHGLNINVIEKVKEDPLLDYEYQQQFMTEDQKELARERAAAELNPLSQSQRVMVKRPFPNLMSADPLMDSRDVLELPPEKGNPYHNRVVVRNHNSIFHEAMALDGFDFENPNWQPTRTDLAEEEMSPNEAAGINPNIQTGQLYTFPLVRRNVTQQTGKGKIRHFQCFMVTGNGDGMVGLGIGTDEEAANAFSKAKVAALKNMDYVNRFEDRTIWTDMKHKFRSTELILRPRPTGFGLRCGPIMHQILKAAGIKDISGKVWGSRNPIMIMQGLLQMLHGGHAPLGMGDGIGGKGKRLWKGIGMRTQFDVERDRGRKLVNIRK